LEREGLLREEFAGVENGCEGGGTLVAPCFLFSPGFGGCARGVIAKRLVPLLIDMCVLFLLEAIFFFGESLNQLLDLEINFSPTLNVFCNLPFFFFSFFVMDSD
jgi:hypothetical protein